MNIPENFSIPVAELEAKLLHVKKAVGMTLQLVNKMRHPEAAQPAQQAQQANQGQARGQDPAVTNQNPNNAAASNNQQTPRQAPKPTPMPRNQSSKDNRTPAAPTSDKPPVSFSNHAPSPHGVPFEYGPTDLTADKLALPPAKKRKMAKDAAAVTVIPTTSPKNSKKSIPVAKPEAVYKCGVAGCEAGNIGFATEVELKKHEDVHKVVEPPITDPLAFALESMRLALGLDENGKSKTKPAGKDSKTDRVTAPGMSTTLSSQGLMSNLKIEGGTPMSRGPTANLSNIGTSKTPQPSGAAKSPASDQKSISKAGPTSAPQPKEERFDVIADPWDGTALGSATDLSTLFPSADELLCYDGLDGLTPDDLPLDDLTPGTTISLSSSSSGTSPPAKHAAFDPATAWMKPVTQGLCGPYIQTDWVHGDDLLDMNWEDAFPADGTVDEGKGRKKGVKKGVADEVPFDSSMYMVGGDDAFMLEEPF